MKTPEEIIQYIKDHYCFLGGEEIAKLIKYLMEISYNDGFNEGYSAGANNSYQV